jgi:hypothetical protein
LRESRLSVLIVKQTFSQMQAGFRSALWKPVFAWRRGMRTAYS